MLAAKVENTPASSGWLLPCTTRLRITAATSLNGWPCSASSTYWKPPEVPRPMIGGRFSGTARPVPTEANSRRSRSISAAALCSAPCRSSKCLSRMMKKPLLDEAIALMKS